MVVKKTLVAYYRLAKPGIVYGNAISASAGFFYGAMGSLHVAEFISMLLGIGAVMASACVYNNILDRSIDAKMERTKSRAVPNGIISVRSASIYGTILLGAGVAVLLFGTNMLTVGLALAGHFAYVVVYGIAKRTTIHSTLLGTVSGATPPVVGYAATTNAVDVIALLLFLILVAWQMPHFYAISIFRREDYQKAGIPVLSVQHGAVAAQKQMLGYMLALPLLFVLMGIYGGLSIVGVLILLLVGLYWPYIAYSTITRDEIVLWSRRQFRVSLYVLIVICTILSVDSFVH